MIMAKEQTNLSIDVEIKKKAKEAQIDLSSTAEKAFKEKLRIKDVEVHEPEDLKCQFCNRPGKKDTIDNLNKNSNSLTWLWPDEKWICNSCLHKKSRGGL